MSEPLVVCEGLAKRFAAEGPAALDGITTPQAYLEATRRDINARYENVVTISLGPVRVGSVDAVRWLYTATVDGEPRMLYQLFVVQGGSPGANEYAGDGPYTRDEVGA